MNSTEAVKPVQVAAVSAKQLQSVYSGHNYGAFFGDYFTASSHLPIKHFESYKPPQKLSVRHNYPFTRYYY